MQRATLARIGCTLALSACAPANVASPARDARATETRAPSTTFDVRALPARPPLLVVARDGDPKAAIALAVSTRGGSIPSTALAALVEARLARAGIERVDSGADRDGYRVRVLVDDVASAERVVAALVRAVETPVGDDPADRKLAAARVAALKATPLDDPALVPIASCTGEGGVLASEPLPDLAAADGASRIEAWRRAFHGVGNVALAVVGPAALGDATAEALSRQPEWPKTAPNDDPWPGETQPVAFVDVGRRRGTAKLVMAVRLRDRAAALSFADRAGEPRAPLVARLATLPVPFHARRVAATVRRAGACVLVEAESDRAPAGASLERSAALASSVIRQEIDVEAAARRDDPSVAAREIRALADPRAAAAAAAWWALSAQGPEKPPAAAIALGIAAPSGAPRGGEDLAAATAPVTASLAREVATTSSAWARPVGEARTRVERGQGEVWVLVGSPCPLVEVDDAAGTSAVAAMAAARSAARWGDVEVEPFVATDGVGIVAHATYAARGETPDELAVRVADAAARAFAADLPSSADVEAARASVLVRLDSSGERAREPLALALAPSSPTRVAPWGLFDSVARVGAAAAALRWEALAEGPVRIAVIANDSEAQAAAAVRAVDRWMLRGATARSCPAAAQPASPLPGARTVPLRPGQPPRGFVALPLDASSDESAGAAAVTALALSGEGGLLARALGSTGARGDAYVAGSGATSALVVELRGPESVLDAGIAQVRALLGRVAQGAVGQEEFDRASRRLSAAELALELDGRSRLVDVWRSRRGASAPSLDGWKAWLASTLQADRAVVVLAKSPPPDPSRLPLSRRPATKITVFANRGERTCRRSTSSPKWRGTRWTTRCCSRKRRLRSVSTSRTRTPRSRRAVKSSWSARRRRTARAPRSTSSRRSSSSGRSR